MDKEKIKKFITTQRENGIPDEQIYSFLVEKGAISKPEQEKSFTGQETSPFQSTGEENLLSGTAKAIGNLPSSTYQMGKNVVSAVVNPIETGKSIVNLVKGVGAKVGETLLEKTDIGQSLLEKTNQSRIASGLPELKRDEKGNLQTDETPELQTINNLTKFVTDRYGSLDKFKETAIEDPAGVLADIATVISGGGALVSKVGKVSKIANVSKVGEQIAKVGQTLEPVTAISKTLGKGKDIISKSKVSQIVKEAIPSVTDIQRNQVSKALDLTPGDLSNIKKSTGNDVTEFIISKDLIKNTPEEVVDALNDTRKVTRDLRNSEISKVTKIYTPDKVQGAIKGLQEIKNGISNVVGLEDEVTKIDNLLSKKTFTLDDIQLAKDLIDDNSSIYSKIGDVKSSATARGLDKLRKEVRKFIEDEVDTATQGTTDIKKLNNDIQTSYAIEDSIRTRATRNLTRDKIGGLLSLILGFGGAAAFNPVVGLGLYIGKKLIDTPSFRLGFTKALNAQPINKIKTILREVKNNTVSPSTQKLINDLADQARKNLQLIESGSAIVEQTKSE